MTKCLWSGTEFAPAKHGNNAKLFVDDEAPRSGPPRCPEVHREAHCRRLSILVRAEGMVGRASRGIAPAVYGGARGGITSAELGMVKRFEASPPRQRRLDLSRRVSGADSSANVGRRQTFDGSSESKETKRTHRREQAHRPLLKLWLLRSPRLRRELVPRDAETFDTSSSPGRAGWTTLSWSMARPSDRPLLTTSIGPGLTVDWSPRRVTPILSSFWITSSV